MRAYVLHSSLSIRNCKESVQFVPQLKFETDIMFNQDIVAEFKRTLTFLKFLFGISSVPRPMDGFSAV